MTEPRYCQTCQRILEDHEGIDCTGCKEKTEEAGGGDEGA